MINNNIIKGIFQITVFIFKQCESDLAEVIMQKAQAARREKVVSILIAIEQEKIFSSYSSTYHIHTKEIFLPIQNNKK